MATKGFQVSAVIPLHEVSLGRSPVILSMPYALVETEIGSGRRQRLQVRRPFAFETEVPTSDLPWVVSGPLRDTTGVWALGDRSMNATSVRREGNELKVDLDPGEGLRLLQVSVPASSVELRSRARQTYFWDDMALLRWGREGHERLALRYLPEQREPEPSTFEANARVRGSRFRLRRAPEPTAASVEVELDSPSDERQVQVLESRGVFSRVRIEGDRHTLSGWITNSMLFKPRDDEGGGGVGFGRSGWGDAPFAAEERTAAPPAEDAWKGLAAVRPGAPLYASHGGEPIASFQLERAVTLRATRASRWVEIMEFPSSSEPIRIISGRLFVRRADVLLNATDAYGLSLQGADPWTGSHLDVFVVRAVAPNSFWSPIFHVGDELVGIEQPTHVTTFPGTDTSHLQGRLESMATELFAGWTRGTGPSTPSSQTVVVRRNEHEVRVVVPTPERSLLSCDNRPGCDEGLVEHLHAECTWKRGAWRCDDRSEVRARERSR